MRSLISNLLDYTETGYKEPAREMIDINPVILDVVGEFQATINEKRARVTVQADGQVLADPLLIRRVLQNLLDNSLKYTEDGQIPHVNIVAKHLAGQQAGTVQIMVSDNGIGIPNEHAERVFEPLQRLHPNESQYAGAGIGLSLAKTVVSAHGGQIEVAREYCGGTRILFTLPGAVQT
jgi:signal transduction histidine kinase